MNIHVATLLHRTMPAVLIQVKEMKILSYENQQSSDIREQETMQAEQTDNSDYKVYGKYKVKSTYSGTDSITDLMMDYASRVASLKY